MGRVARIPFVAVLWVIAAASPAGRSWADPPPAQTVVPDEPYPAPFLDKVKEAVGRGVQALRTAQDDDGSWGGLEKAEYPGGETALATLALLECGVRPDDPAVSRGFAYLRAVHKPKRTYEVGVVLMAIAAKYDLVTDPSRPEETDASGAVVTKTPRPDAVSADDREWMRKEVAFLEENCVPRTRGGAEEAGGLWGYPGGIPGLKEDENGGARWADTSNSQYAVFGLRAAARCGVAVGPLTWLHALSQLLAWQSPKGPPTTLRGNEVRGSTRIEWTEKARARGFGYASVTDPAYASGSMTAAGVAASMICVDALRDSPMFTEKAKGAAREGIRDGLAWIQDRFSVAKNPGRGMAEAQMFWYLYYLYGLERLGDLAHARFFGPQDWYLLGAQKLMEKQRKNGGWDEEIALTAKFMGTRRKKGDLDEEVASYPADTCFALLFLSRSTKRLSHPVITPDPVPTPSGK